MRKCSTIYIWDSQKFTIAKVELLLPAAKQMQQVINNDDGEIPINYI